MAAISLSILPLIFFVIPSIIAIVIISVIAKRKRRRNADVTANVTIQSPDDKKVEAPTVEPLESRTNEDKSAKRKPKSNLVPILICAIFIIICVAIAVWSFMD